MQPGKQQRETLEVYRYHTRTGEMKLLTREHPANVLAWLVDRAGQARLAGSVDRGVVRIWYRDSEGAPWQKLAEEPQGRAQFRPLAFEFDNRTLYVAAYQGGDKAAIYRYDFEKHRVGERVARHLDVDMGTMNVQPRARQTSWLCV